MSGSVLLERDGVLATLGALVDDVSRVGLGASAIVRGAPGIGKTAVLNELEDLASRAGMRVLRASGAELETALAYGVVRQLLDPYAGGWEGASMLARPVLEPELGTPATADPAGVLRGLLAVCASLATGAGAALVIDDAQWADAASLRWLAYLARRVADLPVLVVIAQGAGGQDDATDRLVAAIAACPGTIERTLAPLSEQATAEMIRRAVGPGVPADVCSACHTATGGNPFYLRELVVTGGARLLTVGGAIEEMAPQSVSRAVVSRLAGLGSAATRLARAVSVLGDRAPLRLAYALAGLDPDSAASAVDALAGASVLDDCRPPAFVHPIVRAAVYADLAGGARSTLHRRAAQLLADDGADVAAVAVQLVATEPSGDPWVVERLRVAALLAARRGDPRAAVICLERALHEPCAEADRGQLLFDLGVAAGRAGLPVAAGHLHAALEYVQDAVRRAQVATALCATLSVLPGPADVAAAAAAQAIAATAQRAPALAARLEAGRIRLACMRLVRDRPDTRGAHALLARLGPGDAAASELRGVLAGDALLHGAGAQAVWELVGEAGDVDCGGLCLAVSAMLSERLDIAECGFADALGRARRSGSDVAAGYVLSFRSELMLRRGLLREAEADAREALEALGPFGPLPAVAALIDALVARGEIGEALSVLEANGCSERLPETLPAVLLLARRIRLRVAAGDHQGALADVSEVERLVGHAGFERAVTLTWRLEAALACQAAGEVEQARRFAHEQLRLARDFGARGILGTALRVAGVVQGGPAGLALLRESVERLEPTPLALERAYALAALGVAQRHAGVRVAARGTLAYALDIADGCGAAGVVEQTRAELVIAGARPRRNRLHGRDALTASELRTATLAADGLTNSQIAQSLFVSAKTVERHLTNVYAKLGIACRDDVCAALAVAVPA